MADLTTLDPTQPPDTQSRAQGAARIRETRDAIITSFDVEHHLSGAHQFLFGTVGSRPAAGIDGRIFGNTTGGQERLERDNGSAWRMLNAVQLGVATTNGSIACPAGSGTVIQTLAVDVPTGGRLLALCLLAATSAAANVPIVDKCVTRVKHQPVFLTVE